MLIIVEGPSTFRQRAVNDVHSPPQGWDFPAHPPGPEKGSAGACRNAWPMRFSSCRYEMMLFLRYLRGLLSMRPHFFTKLAQMTDEVCRTSKLCLVLDVSDPATTSPDQTRTPGRFGTRSGIDVVTMIIVANLLVFLYMNELIGSCGIVEFVSTYAISVDGLQAGYWWQPISHQFLHGGDLGAVMRVTHIALNMLVVYNVGKLLLDDVGTKHWLGIYFLSGILGGALQILVTPHSPLLGASGAAFGLITAYTSLHAFELLEAWFMGFKIKVNGRTFAQALVLSSILLGVLSLVSGQIPMVSNMGHFAHLGGALGGIIYVRLLGNGPKSLSRDDLQRAREENDARIEAQRSSEST